MVEEPAPENSDMYWIVTKKDSICWMPGIKVEGQDKSIIVKCLSTSDKFEINRADAILVHPSCLGKQDFPTSQTCSI